MINIPMNTRPPVSLSDMAAAQANPAGNAQPAGNMANGMQNSQPANNMANTMQNAQPANNMANGMQNAQPVNNMANTMQNAQPVNNMANSMQNAQPVNNAANAVPAQAAAVNNTATVPRPAATGVILKKGQKTSLAKFGNALENIDVGLGWDVANQGVYDLDAECFILGADDKVLGDEWFVYYNQPASPDGSICHSGDNRTGDGTGDDEVINVRLSRVNPQAQKLVFVVTINEAKERNLNFSGVQNAYIRLVDKETNRELCRFNLTEYYSNVTSMVVAELYRHNGEWKMNPVGDGMPADLYDLCIRYGVNVAG